MTTASEALKVIKDSGAKYLDLRFTDVKGKWQHLTMDGTIVDEDFLNEGTFFDGSSISGWKPINESDMVLKPDLSTLVMDIEPPVRHEARLHPGGPAVRSAAHVVGREEPPPQLQPVHHAVVKVGDRGAVRSYLYFF